MLFIIKSIIKLIWIFVEGLFALFFAVLSEIYMVIVKLFPKTYIIILILIGIWFVYSIVRFIQDKILEYKVDKLSEELRIALRKDIERRERLERESKKNRK